MNYLQMNDHSKFDEEEKSLQAYFEKNNIEYKPFYKKHLIQNKLKITRDDFIAGEVPTMFAAMKQLGIEYNYQDYPDYLKKYLYRKIWESTMGDIKNQLFDIGNIDAVFIKPKDNLKKFTGFVITCIDDLQYTNHAGNNTKIYCSEPVVWLSEFRCPVIDGKVRGMFRTPYTCQGSAPDINEVQKIADDFIGSPKAYCLDVGVLSTGETALVEVNDAFSIGKYGMSDDLYAELVMTRWNELKSV